MRRCLSICLSVYLLPSTAICNSQIQKMVQFVKCLSCNYEDLSLITKAYLMVHAYNSSSAREGSRERRTLGFIDPLL